MKNKKPRAQKKINVSAIQFHLEQCEKKDKLRAKIEQIDGKIAALLQMRAEMIGREGADC